VLTDSCAAAGGRRPRRRAYPGDTVATISKRWFAIRDTLGVEVGAGEDEALVPAFTACIGGLSNGA
jgi:hypothetical protein